MSAELVAILRAELAQQRRFLSSDEERVLLRPATYDNEADLALDRVKHREHEFVAVLRDRFVRDHRPLQQWWSLLTAQEAAQGYRTMIGAMAVQVLDWSARTSDQQAMMGGFASKLLLLAACFAGFFAVVTTAFGAWPAGVILLVLTAALWLGARIIGSLTTNRVDALLQSYKRPPLSEEAHLGRERASTSERESQAD